MSLVPLNKSVSTLVHLALMEFYLIDRADLKVDGSVAILGGNRTGKSCLLDAIQTGLTGGSAEHMFYNASAIRTGKKSDRTLAEYCLGVVQHDEKDKPTVQRASACTWIALAFRRHDGVLVTGLVNAMAREGRPKVDLRWMIVTGKIVTTEDLTSFDENGAEVSANFSAVHDRLCSIEGSAIEIVEYDRAEDYCDQLLLALSHGGWRPDAGKYLKALRRALKFEPVDNVTAFMREHILEIEPIDIERMRERLGFYRALKTTVEDLERQIQSLGDIASVYDEAAGHAVEARGRMAAAWEACLDYWTVETHAREQEFAARKAERARAHEAYLYAETVKDDAYTALAEAKVAHDTNPLERQIKNEEDALKAGSLALQRTLTDLKERADCSEAIRAGLEASAPFTRATKGKAVEQLQLLASDAAEFRNAWTSKDHENIRKHGERLEALLKTNGPAAVEEATQVKHAAAAALAELNKEKQRLARVADSAGEGHASISADARDLILELRDARIPAHPVCDVIEIKPAFEPWRNAAEAVLGRSREALIVRDADHHRAISIQRQRRTSRPIEIIKPSIADAANYDAPDSLAAVFETEDPVAAGLISHLTGRIKRVATEAELAREQSAVTKDLMRSTPISTYKMSPPFPLLVGREGRRLAAEDARIQLQQLDAKLRGAEKTLDLIDRMLLAVKTLAGLARDKSWKSISELVQDMAGCLKAIEDASAQIARLKSDRPQEWAEESKKLEAAKAAAGLALMRAKEQSDAAIIATERAESAVAAGLREKEAAAYELFRHQVDDADPAAVARNHHLARTLNHAVPAERLLAITQLRDSARDYEQESARLANEADELWHEHFTKDFPNEALPELPESPKWEDRLAATRKRLNQLSDSTLIGKKADVAKAEKDLAEVFKLEFVGRLVEAFGRIRHAYEDLNNEVRNRDFYGESYIFTKEPEEAYLDIIELVRKAENPNWDMPLWSTAEDESAEQRALARITRFIEEKDDEHLRGLRDPKAYWRFDTKIVNSVTGEQVSNLNRRMRSGSGGEGQIPQYIAVVAAVVARSLSPRRDKGALPLVLLDEAFSQLDVQHTRKIMQFMRELGLQVFLAAPDGKTAQVVHGVDTIINVFRDDKDVSLLVETVTDELRDDLSDEDPRLTGFARFKALRDSSEPEMLLEASE